MATRMLCAAVWAAGLSWLTAAGGAYLPVVGPSPIRVQSPAKPGRPPLRLPEPTAVPLVAPSTNGVVWVPPGISDANTNPVETLKATLPIEPRPEPAAAELTSLPALPSRSESAAPTLTPQMLVPFFEHRTVRPDGKETGVIAPVPFVPPRSSAGASSRAVLRTD